MSPRRLPIAWLWLVVAVVFGASTLEMGAYALAADLEQLKQARELARGESLPADQAAMFEKVVGDELQKLTKPSEANLGNLPKWRNIFVKGLLPAGRNGDPRDRVLALTIARAKQVIEGDFPLPVKANFVLLLGDLDESSPANPPAKPSKQAFDMLLALAQPKSATSDGDVLLVEALVGLQRHVLLFKQGAPPPEGGIAKLTRAMLAILNESTPPEGRSVDGQMWMRRSAGQLLALIGNPGEGDQVVKALEAVLRDPNAPLFLRCGLAQYAGEIKYAETTEPSPAAMAKNLVELAHDACRMELAKARRAGREPSERAFKQWLEALQDGISGASRAKETQAPPLKGLVRAIAAVPDSKEAIQTAKKDIDKLLEMVNNREFVALAQAIGRRTDSTKSTARRE